jgi:hypothetical protein
MTAAALVQGGVIALAVAWSAAYALRRLLPVTSRRIAARVLAVFDRPGAPPWLQRGLAALAPRATSGASCADGCSSCNGCGAPAEPVAEVRAIPLAFRPRSGRSA